MSVADEQASRRHHLARSSGFVFFWGHQPSKDGRVTESCLSQWWPSAFVVDGLSYPSAEHFMMAEKARLFSAPAALVERMRTAATPKEAKALGREVEGFVAERWAERRFEFVVAGNLAKFSQDETLRSFLISTSPKLLVEASPLDSIWGIGLGAAGPRAARPEEWPGLNLLGFALMDVRERLLHAA